MRVPGGASRDRAASANGVRALPNSVLCYSITSWDYAKHPWCCWRPCQVVYRGGSAFGTRPNDEAEGGLSGEPEPDDDRPRSRAGTYTVRSVARALRLVEIVADGPAEGLSLSELARALGTSKSSTLALARTLVAASATCAMPPRARLHARHGADQAGRHRRPAAPARRPVPPADRGPVPGDQDDRAGGDQRWRVPGLHRPGGRPGQRPLPHPARPARGAVRLGGGQGDPRGHGRRRGPAHVRRRPGWRPGPRTPSPTSTRCWTTWPRSGGSASRSMTRRTRRGFLRGRGVLRPRRGPARARSALPASRATCPPGGSTSSAGPCAATPTGVRHPGRQPLRRPRPGRTSGGGAGGGHVSPRRS